MESPRQSDSDTVEYWKKLAKYYEQKVSDIQQELDEYTENSAQLEKELEASLVQVEKQNRDLEHQNQRLKNEIEMLRSKLERSQQETNALENELQALKIDKDKQGVYIRELEQKNDDLERGQRVISESVSCIESLLNQAYERNAVLESEVDEIETLRVRLQRATDEARDLKHELKVMEKVPKPKKGDESTIEGSLVNGHISNPSRTQVEIETQTSLMSPQKREINGNGMTPSSRVTAINIVGDLLRKVGALESKLASCRGTVRPKEHSPNSASDVNKDYRCVLKN
ncbi:nuclear distribution protein nudE-like 1 isoform X2 [Helicoverpa zea]|uniref:nuclear distribution protein nudE-like 1 isoform X2 n=1 Tax=Helicoverpa zea TaxID=7113 RepID=UPI001F583E6B|nr:nuclear distribution protein nudE-like 1 isoform X2 [Helicoverpa zea]